MKKIKVLTTFVIILTLILGQIQFASADQFWNLYQLGEQKQTQGDLIGAINAWKGIVQLYANDNSSNGLTREALYWSKIADAYYSMGWFGEAEQAYKIVEYYWDAQGAWESALGPNRTANRLSTDLEVYAKVTAQTNQNLAKFEPKSGTYFGAPFDKDPIIQNNLSQVKDAYGKEHSAYLMYVRWGDPIQEETVEQVKELGEMLQIAWEPPADMSTIKSQDVLAFANKLKDLGVPIFLRFASEMNDASNPWSQNSPEVYKKAFSLVADIMHKNAPNVAMVWSPSYVNESTISSYYPGDTVVDWVGINGYTDRYFVGDPNQSQLTQDIYYQGYYANPLDRFQYIYDTYSSKKPIMICETGVENYSMSTGEDFSSWASNNLQRLYGYIPLKYPRIKAIFYFNVDSNLVPTLGMKQNYVLSRSSNIMNTYKDVIQNPYYLSSYGENINFEYKPLEQVNINKNSNLQLSAYSKIIDPNISHADYWIDGKKVASLNKIPFNADINISNLSDGSHILRVDVFNSKKEMSARRCYTININGSNATFVAGEVQYMPRHVVLSDISDHWAKDQINELVSLWSVDGYDDGTFQPEKQITRAEFYKLLSTALGMNLQVSSNTLEIDPNYWAKDLLNGGVQLNIIDSKYYNNGFDPNKPITRKEMAMWAVRALNSGQTVTIQNTKFNDNNEIPNDMKGYISKANEMGIIDGFPDNTFRANETSTRAQAVSLVLRAVEYQNK